MKKFLTVSLLTFSIILISGCSLTNNQQVETKNWSIDKSFGSILSEYVEKEFSRWYYCDELEWHKYFFDILSFPYQESWQYLVSFSVWWYSLTEFGNVTNCWWGWEILVIKYNGNAISLIRKFSDFEKMPEDMLKLLQKRQTTSTVYEQAKKYFKINEKNYTNQECPKKLCDKTRYSVIETWESMNDDINVYTTIPPVELRYNWWRWRWYVFSWNHTMIETNHECPDEWCIHTWMKWEMVSENTLSYLSEIEEPNRMYRLELVEVSDKVLKIRHLYK